MSDSERPETFDPATEHPQEVAASLENQETPPAQFRIGHEDESIISAALDTINRHLDRKARERSPDLIGKVGKAARQRIKETLQPEKEYPLNDFWRAVGNETNYPIEGIALLRQRFDQFKDEVKQQLRSPLDYINRFADHERLVIEYSQMKLMMNMTRSTDNRAVNSLRDRVYKLAQVLGVDLPLHAEAHEEQIISQYRILVSENNYANVDYGNNN